MPNVLSHSDTQHNGEVGGGHPTRWTVGGSAAVGLPGDWIDTVQCMDCLEGMRQLPEACIDHAVFSPPYDQVRAYNGFEYDLARTGEELYRVMKDGAIAAMVIQDQTVNFGKSLTSFRTIVDWCDRIGFKLFECVIYRKNGSEGAWWKHRFRVDHEYIPLFLKGEKPLYNERA